MIIELNKKIYSLAAIKEAIKAFEDHCSAAIEKQQESAKFYRILVKKKTNVGDEELKNEFCNYCLGLMKK